jgi:hypothetical protein
MMRFANFFCALVFAIACAACSSSGTTTTEIPLANIGPACDGGASSCGGGASCGTCGIATGQCSATCSGNGFGADAGCPEGTFCSASWSGSTVHVCVRVCTSDQDCHIANPDTSCNGAYLDDGGSGPEICNVPNEVGSTHTCP